MSLIWTYVIAFLALLVPVRRRPGDVPPGTLSEQFDAGMGMIIAALLEATLADKGRAARWRKELHQD